MNECSRHKTAAPYRIARCCHIGDRFVVQMERPERRYTTIDYVEDLADGGLIVEATDWYEAEPQEIETVWSAKLDRLRTDLPPDPDHAYTYLMP